MSLKNSDFEEFHKKLNERLISDAEFQEHQKKEEKRKKRKKVNRWRTAGIWSAFHSLWYFLYGVWKISVYINEEDYKINAYVGGDAYNYIINACQATALWVLSGVFLIAAFGCAYIYYKKKSKL